MTAGYVTRESHSWGGDVFTINHGEEQQMVESYEQQVYAAVLGKMAGVYLGRPFEGWSRERIRERWGEIPGYVHEECGSSLVVTDDDLSGTFTFIRGLEDSGQYAKTPDRLFGEAWLNYLLENQTILWWGGMSHSTEQTAYLRLKHGIESPRSGSMQLNGKKVSEQIGAQIFIDAFGMVAPGNPALAAELAAKAARVSHDGEAVIAAQVVAAMVSIAFEVKDIYQVMDEAVRFIPADSLIARIHRDVRAWFKQDGNWETTFRRIQEVYGYEKYDGDCHVVPNHAAMVMGWCYGGNNFYRTLRITSSAGWDTDCNAGNVGSVAALIAGLDGINADYDFQGPAADQLLLPTADGTETITDALQVAMHIAAIGRRLNGQEAVPAPRNGARHHFSLPGALHGYQLDETAFCGRGCAKLSNPRGEGLDMEFAVGPGRIARVATCVCLNHTARTAYSWQGTPWLNNGMSVRLRGTVGQMHGEAALRLQVKTMAGNICCSEAFRLDHDGAIALDWKVDCGGGDLPGQFGWVVEAEKPAHGRLHVDSVEFTGDSELDYAGGFPCVNDDSRKIPGWISSMDFCRGPFAGDGEAKVRYFGENENIGIMVTGGRFWGDCALSCNFRIHAADRAGIVLRWQGMRRHYFFRFTAGKVQLVRCLYGETVLAETGFCCQEDQPYAMTARAEGTRISLSCNGRELLAANDSALENGGAGFRVEGGLFGFDCLRIHAQSTPQRP